LESGILFNQSSKFSDVLESGISSVARLHVMSCRSCVQCFNCSVIKKHKYTMSSFSCVYLPYPWPETILYTLGTTMCLTIQPP